MRPRRPPRRTKSVRNPRRALVVAVIALHLAAAEQPAREQVLALLADVCVDIRVIDRTIDAGRVRLGKSQRPDGELPVAHVQRDADGGPELVAVPLEDFLIDDLDPRGVGEQAVHQHGFGHDAAEILPVRRRDDFPLRIAFFRKGDGKVVEGSLMPLGINDGCECTPGSR